MKFLTFLLVIALIAFFVYQSEEINILETGGGKKVFLTYEKANCDDRFDNTCDILERFNNNNIEKCEERALSIQDQRRQRIADGYLDDIAYCHFTCSEVVRINSFDPQLCENRSSPLE